MRGSEACVRLLVKAGADLHITDQMALTAAAHAHRKGYMTCEKLLTVTVAPKSPRMTRSNKSCKTHFASVCRSTKDKVRRLGRSHREQPMLKRGISCDSLDSVGSSGSFGSRYSKDSVRSCSTSASCGKRVSFQTDSSGSSEE